jgi:osmotically-inducible protein OsmY
MRYQGVIVKFIFNRPAASIALAVVAGSFITSASIAAPAASMSTNDMALASAVQVVLVKSMGDAAKDLTVTAQNGAVTLHGFVNQPREEDQARYVTSKVPGVTAAYSKIHTWSSNDRY